MPSDGKSSHCLWQGELKNSACTGHLIFYKGTKTSVLVGGTF